jgi:hypothetical protein
MIPKVPRIKKNTGRYAMRAKVYVLPAVKANTHPPIPVKTAKMRFAYFSPIED